MFGFMDIFTEAFRPRIDFDLMQAEADMRASEVRMVSSFLVVIEAQSKRIDGLQKLVEINDQRLKLLELDAAKAGPVN